MVIEIEYVKLGNTDLVVSRIGLGCEILGGTDWGEVDLNFAVSAVRRAVDLGVNVFDTADVYGLGQSEEVLSRALGSDRHDMVIVSKCGIRWEPSPHGGRARTYHDASPEYVVRAVEASLKRLRLEAIPVYLIHWPDPRTPIEATLNALLKCQAQGKIRYFGFSNFDKHQLRPVERFVSAAVLEVSYNLIDKSSEDTITYAGNVGWGVLAYGVLAQGLLTGKYSPSTKFGKNDRRHRLPHFSPEAWPRNQRILTLLDRMARDKGATISQLAVSWVLANRAVSVALTGARTPEQVDENVGALAVRLDQDDLNTLRVC